MAQLRDMYGFKAPNKTALTDPSADPTAEPAAVSFPISNPSTDFLFSLMAGFTQSETSTAWCGNHVVVGFNDSGSFFESLLFGPGGASR